MARSELTLVVLAVATFIQSGTACEECVVVDLSHWNANVDMEVFRSAGVEGIIHKATQGATYVDSEYETRAAEAALVGILWGAYHFGDATPGDVQARHFLDVVGNWGRVLLALDLEPNSSQMNVTNAEAFVETVLGITGRLPMIYGSPSFLENKVPENSILARCPLWLAQWGPTAHPPAPWANYTLWQYSDGAHGPEPRNIPGYNGHVDRDRYNPVLHPSLQHMWFSRPV